MMHHKRGRPKNRRAGCLLCKPWKMNGFARRRRKDGQRFSDVRRRVAAEDALFDAWHDPATGQTPRADD